MNILRAIKDEFSQPILNMNASWNSRPYELEDNVHLGIQLKWDNAAVTGTIYLDYSLSPIVSGSSPMTIEGDWLTNNTVTLDGTFQQIMFLDANLAITAFRLRFVRTAGTANLLSYVNRKKGGRYNANN